MPQLASNQTRPLLKETPLNNNQGAVTKYSIHRKASIYSLCQDSTMHFLRASLNGTEKVLETQKHVLHPLHLTLPFHSSLKKHSHL